MVSFREVAPPSRTAEAKRPSRARPIRRYRAEAEPPPIRPGNRKVPGIDDPVCKQTGPPALPAEPSPACAGDKPGSPRSRSVSTRENGRPAKGRLAVSEAFAGFPDAPAAETADAPESPPAPRRVNEHPPRHGATDRWRWPQNPGGLRGRTTTFRRVDAFACTGNDENPVWQIQLKTDYADKYSVHNCCKFTQFSHKLST